MLTRDRYKFNVSRVDRINGNYNEETGKLTAVQKLELLGAGPMTASADRKRLYVKASGPPKDGNRRRGAGIATLDVAAAGTVKLAHVAPVNIGPGYLSLDKTQTYLAGNHYGPGKATVWKLKDGVYRGETVAEPALEQRTHSAVFSPCNKFLLVPATGPNKVFQLRFDAAASKVVPNDPPFAPGPAGENEARQPRHLVFHPTLPVVYTSNERERPGVGMWAWDAASGTLKAVQNLVSIPPGFKGTIRTADVHVTPDGKYLYVSNRDRTDRRARTGNNTIAGYSLDPKTGRMTSIGYFPCEHIPRSIDLDEKGRYLYVAGQMDDTLGVYRVDPATGKLSRVEQHKVPARPSWVHCMEAGR